MTPTDFPQSNTTFGPPRGFDESQVETIHAAIYEQIGGNMDGTQCVVVAWQPDADDLKRLNDGGPVFLSVVGGLPPHFLCTEFPYNAEEPA